MSSHLTPITLEEFELACQTLSLPEALGEKKRLENSVSHLIRSNSELDEFLKEEDDEELRAAINENKEIINIQKRRIEILNRHMDEMVGGNNSDPVGNPKGAGPVTTGTSEEKASHESETGIYL
jgi:hypothetical protein